MMNNILVRTYYSFALIVHGLNNFQRNAVAKRKSLNYRNFSIKVFHSASRLIFPMLYGVSLIDRIITLGLKLNLFHKIFQ